MIDVNKKYRTRDGQEVSQLVKFDCCETHPIYGVIEETLYSWDELGYYNSSKSSGNQDLIEVKPEVWGNLCYNEKSGYYFISCVGNSKEEIKGIVSTCKYIKSIRLDA